jgi:hypothetical protein
VHSNQMDGIVHTAVRQGVGFARPLSPPFPRMRPIL